MVATQNAVGTRVPRIEGFAKVTGGLQYAYDIYLPGMLYAKVLRSPYAHARIIKIDATKAKAYPGVIAVITAKDIPNFPREATGRGLAILAYDEALFYGQPIAAVVATAVDIAEEALSLLEVEYQELPVVVDPVEAMKDDSPPTRRPVEMDSAEEQEHMTMAVTGEVKEPQQNPNIAQHLVFERGDIEKGFAEADVVIEKTFRTSWVHQGYIETHNAVVNYDPNGQFTVYGSNRGQFPLRTSLSHILGVSETKIRVMPLEPGGAFGSKTTPLAEGLCAVLAREVRRPVKLVMSRSEDLKASVPAPQAIITLKTGAKKDGSLTAIRATLIYDAGAFPGGPVLAGCNLIGGYYRWPNLHIDGYAVVTNKASVGALRAPGVPQATFAIESQMDILARELGLDPLEFRMKNAVEEGDLLPNNRAYPRIGLKEVISKVAETALWKRRHNLPKNHGVGIAIGGWLGGMQPSGAVLTLNGDGTFSVSVGSIDVTGVNTAFTQIAADFLGVPMSSVNVRTGDSSAAPFAGQSGGSKTLRTVGRAVQLAAQDALDQMFSIAADRLEARPEDMEAVGGQVRVKGSPDRALGFDLLATLTSATGSSYPPIVGRGNAESPPQAPSFTCQAVEVEVDPDTGQVSLIDSVCAQDVGYAINPLSVEGQIQGGVVQSLSMGFLEEMVFDDKGILRNPTLLDYRMPTALDMPRINAIIVEVPSSDPLYGVRGVGEPPITAGATAVTNGIFDAVGARVYHIPATPERIIRALGKMG
ncbi:MAG: aldehyde oxidase and xanthine dehydrogenase molybdopterin binding protein [Dehalococcoidia bacterium]|nr:aldehyde oxidase and xanthine dehydrogenase molybdopterin binding protein [Dehalococcoidia bacterium]